MELINTLVDHYANLLIIQYNQKPKAAATIRLLARELLMNGLFDEVDRAFNLDTAVGAQLDIIGMYVGVDRYYSEIDPVDYFAVTDFSEDDPDAEQKHGLSTFETFDDFAYNGTLTYNSVVTTQNELGDDDYRRLIRLKILQNHSDHSHQSIDEGMYGIFGSAVQAYSDGGMTMSYVVSAEYADLMRVALRKGVIPRPMGVGLFMVVAQEGVLFGMAEYTYTPDNIAGFQTYQTYGSVEGSLLTYNDIITL